MVFDLQGIGMTSRRTRLRLIDQLQQQGIKKTAVLDALTSVPRHIFVDEALAHRAYENTALPIGNNQTISQPYIVAKMTELLLDERPLKRVLEIGTGSGYQAAILANIAEQVFTVERIEALLEKARLRFRALKLYNISSKLTDGQWGWPAEGPFDGIIVTAAPSQIPAELMTQLAEGCRMVVPAGTEGDQQLYVLTKKGNSFVTEFVEEVRFVPLLEGTVR
jgi:protein-L-isoaspartate(D-aspartate) O-methyltransferase